MNGIDGIDEGVSRFEEGAFLIDDDGLRGACGARVGTLVLALEVVPQLAERSGVREIAPGGCNEVPEALVGKEPFPEPTEETEANDVADAIATELIGDHSSVDILDVGETGFSFESDFLI